MFKENIFNVYEIQKNSFVDLLNFDQSKENISLGSPSAKLHREGNLTWKVLIYDKACQDRIAPVLKVGELRQQGVTLFLNIATKRAPINEVPAVYFIDPTEENLRYLIEDLRNDLYKQFYLYFSYECPSTLLQQFAQQASIMNKANRIAGVIDSYLSYTSLGANLFTLSYRNAYLDMHSRNDLVVSNTVETIANQLLSVLLSMNQCPIIRYSSNTCSEYVAKRLLEKLKELSEKKVNNKQLSMFQKPLMESKERVVLVLLDRNFDIGTVVEHNWKYQSLIHEFFHLKLNYIQMSNDKGAPLPPTPQNPNPNQMIELDPHCHIYQKLMHLDYPDAASEAHSLTLQYDTKEKEITEMNAKPTGADKNNVYEIEKAINKLPQLTLEKKSLATHMNILTSLLNIINDNAINDIIQLENSIYTSKNSDNAVKQVIAFFRKSPKLPLANKLRTVMILLLSNPALASQLNSITMVLNEQHPNETQQMRALDYVKKFVNSRENLLNLKNNNLIHNNSNQGGSGIGGISTNLNTAANVIIGKKNETLDFLSTIANQFKNQVTSLFSYKQSIICSIVKNLLENNDPMEEYKYLDTKSLSTPSVAKNRTPMRKAIVFVIGGGNYEEAISLKSYADNNDKQIIYGSTELLTPAEFLNDFITLEQSS